MSISNRHLSRLLAAAAALAVLSLAPVGGLEAQQEDRPARDVHEVVERTYPDGVAERVRDLLGRARGSGLPADALGDRALEAAAKGVEGERLLSSLRGRLADLRRADRALGAGADPASVKAGASALREGLEPEEIRRVAKVAAGPERPAALVVVAELKAAGLPVGPAVDAVADALSRGRDAPALLDFGARVRTAAGRGLTPSEALRAARDPARRLMPSVPGRPPGTAILGAPGAPVGPPVPHGSGPPRDDPPGIPPVSGGAGR